MRSSVEEMKRLSELIGRINRQLAVLNRQLNKLAKPILTDYSLLPYIWSEFISFSKKKGHNPMTVYERQKFLFASMMLFYPKAIIGRRMGGGLRAALSEAIGVTGFVISNNIRDVRILYDNYKDFSRDVDYFCAEICEKLGKKLPRRS